MASSVFQGHRGGHFNLPTLQDKSFIIDEVENTVLRYCLSAASKGNRRLYHEGAKLSSVARHL